MAAGLEVKGAEGLDLAIGKLEGRPGKRIVRAGVRAGAKIVQKASKANALSMVGGKMGALLAAMLKVRAQKRSRTATKAGIVGVNVIIDKAGNNVFVYTSKKGKQSYIPYAIEYGHGKAKDEAARPYMRKAADEHGQRAVDAMIEKTWQGVRKIWAKP